MKSIRSTLGLSAAVVLTGFTLLITPAVYAVQSTNSGSSSDSSESTQSTNSKKLTKISDRITEYKTKQALKLALVEETRLKGVCKAAQVKVKAVDTRTTTANTGRTKIYTGIIKQLDAIIPKLKAASVDTTELQATQTKLSELVQKYKDDFATFQTTLGDVSELDCVTDPAAFKSALLSARADRTVIIADAKAIRDYIPTVKAALVNAKKALNETKDATTDTTTTENTTTGGTQ